MVIKNCLPLSIERLLIRMVNNKVSLMKIMIIKGTKIMGMELNINNVFYILFNKLL
jgi:hypothetical protein